MIEIGSNREKKRGKKTVQEIILQRFETRQLKKEKKMEKKN